MQLKSVQIKNFKCIDDSSEFNVAPVTCLVGKNEAGKTALLEGLYKLNPDVKGREHFNGLLEYPRRRWKEYEQGAQRAPDDALIARWELDDEDVASLQEVLGQDVLESRTVTVRKGYYEGAKWIIELDEAKVAESLLGSASLDDADRKRNSEASSVQDLIHLLEEREGPSQDEQRFLQQLKEKFSEGSAQAWAETWLAKRLPTFLYFSTYQTLPGRVSIDALLAEQGNKETNLSHSDRVFLALLGLANTDAKQIAEIESSEELIAGLEAASAHITAEIFTYWTQNRNLRVSFDLHPGKAKDPAPFNKGLVFETRILNTRHHVTLNFGERSTGFVWFFSFLVWFSQVKRIHGENLVILLDDPGLGLHAKAQGDLLRYISQRLEPHYQVIYTTHSPFMIDPDKLLRARTVEDVVRKTEDGGEECLGTKVGDRVLSSDADTLFPLQAALGYEITQTLFVGKNTLLVEGPSDLLYLKWFSKRLAEQSRTGLHPAWTIAPAGGVDKISAFMVLFGGNKLNVAVLLDFAQGQKGKVRKLKESNLLKQGSVFAADMYANRPEADIEDIVGPETYFALVNLCYGLRGPQQISASGDIPPSLRVVEQVNRHFRTLPAGAPDFDHYAPAEFLSEHGKELTDKLPALNEALDRFERLFRDLNACLPPD